MKVETAVCWGRYCAFQWNFRDSVAFTVCEPVGSDVTSAVTFHYVLWSEGSVSVNRGVYHRAEGTESFAAPEDLGIVASLLLEATR